MDHSDKLCRLCEAMDGAEKVAIPWGNHSLSNRVQETASLISSREKDLRGGMILRVDDLSDTFNLLLTKEKNVCLGCCEDCLSIV